MQTGFAWPRRLFERSRNVSNVMPPSPSMASEFNRRVADLVHYFLEVAWDQTHQCYATPVTIDLAAPDADMPIRTIRDVLEPAAEGYDIATYFSESNVYS